MKRGACGNNSNATAQQRRSPAPSDECSGEGDIVQPGYADVGVRDDPAGDPILDQPSEDAGVWQRSQALRQSKGVVAAELEREDCSCSKHITQAAVNSRLNQARTKSQLDANWAGDPQQVKTLDLKPDFQRV
eukprot:1159207-Pelagomonas_calceolata.AAC.1